MAIYHNGQRVTPYKGDCQPVNIYHGSQNVAGWLPSTKSGTLLSFPDTYKTPVDSLSVYGKSTQSGTPTPSAPMPITSIGDSGGVAVTAKSPNIIDTDFSNTTGWYGITSTFTVANHVAIVTSSSSSTLSPPTLWKNTLVRPLNQRYYIQVKARVLSSGASVLKFGGSRCAVSGESSITNPVINSWYTFKVVITVNDGVLASTYGIVTTYPGASIGNITEIKDVMLIDMGANALNPYYNLTAAQMDAMFPTWLPKVSNSITVPMSLRSLPDGTQDIVELVSGAGTRNIGVTIISAGSSWMIADAEPNSTVMCTRCPEKQLVGQTLTIDGGITEQATILYKLATPVQISLTPQTLTTTPLHCDISAGGAELSATVKVVDTTL